MKRTAKVLVVDDERSITGVLEIILGEQGYEVQTAGTVADGLAIVRGSGPFDLIFTDLRLPDATGIELLTQVKQEHLETEVILITAHGSLDITIEAIKKGAYYYLEKPFTPDQVVMLTARALEFAAVRRENRHLKRTMNGEVESFGLVGRTPRMQQIYETIRATAASDASVLIEGESGTGKELIATAFHMQSQRAARAFMRINCAAIPPDLIESELFGYKKGAFTGADRDKRGLIEATAGGTLLLDEIAEMPVHLQTKLLRVLQEKRLRRLGDEQEIAVDFRLVTATNRDTQQAMQNGLLREDLYFRMSTIRIRVPPLRERLDDLILLTELFLHRYSQKYNRPISGVSQAALALLARYHWPGNVRELESVIERAVLFCQGREIGPEHLSEDIAPPRTRRYRCEIPPYLTLEEIEREAIEQTLERTDYNIKRTAQILDLHRSTFYRKLRKFGLKGDEADEQAPD
jgi:DNA-binding NtrC family response regulator